MQPVSRDKKITHVHFNWVLKRQFDLCTIYHKTSLEGMSHIHIGPEINCGDVEQLNVSCFDCSKKINSSQFFAIFFMSAILTGVAITGEAFYFLYFYSKTYQLLTLMTSSYVASILLIYSPPSYEITTPRIATTVCSSCTTNNPPTTTTKLPIKGKLNLLNQTIEFGCDV